MPTPQPPYVVRLLVSLFLAVCAAALSAHAKPFKYVAVLTGVVTVKDGDGVLFGKVEIRLQGIAAPEDSSLKREPGGPESTANLRALVENKDVRCELDGTLAGTRPAGICYLNGRDIGEYQVSTGHARDCPRHSGGRYADVEREAHLKGRRLLANYPLPNYCLTQ